MAATYLLYVWYILNIYVAKQHEWWFSYLFSVYLTEKHWAEGESVSYDICKTLHSAVFNTASLFCTFSAHSHRSLLLPFICLWVSMSNCFRNVILPVALGESGSRCWSRGHISLHWPGLRCVHLFHPPRTETPLTNRDSLANDTPANVFYWTQSVLLQTCRCGGLHWPAATNPWPRRATLIGSNSIQACLLASYRGHMQRDAAVGFLVLHRVNASDQTKGFPLTLFRQDVSRPSRYFYWRPSAHRRPRTGCLFRPVQTAYF